MIISRHTEVGGIGGFFFSEYLKIFIPHSYCLNGFWDIGCNSYVFPVLLRCFTPSSDSFRIFSSVFIFCGLKMICQGNFFGGGFYIARFLWTYWICGLVSNIFLKKFSVIVLYISSIIFFFLSSFQCYYYTIFSWPLVLGFSLWCFFIFISFAFCFWKCYW